MSYKKRVFDCLKKGKVLCFFRELLVYSWKGDDLFSYLLFFLIVFLAYNYVFTPFVFPLLFKTKIPFNTIVSESMEHNLDFENWWERYGFFYEKYFNITKNDFENFPFKEGLDIGDFVFIVGIKNDDIKVGDIVVYYVPNLNKYIVHRVVKIKENGCFETLGDNNIKLFFYGLNPQLPFEKNVCEIEGKVVFKIPYLGLPRYWLFVLSNEIKSIL